MSRLKAVKPEKVEPKKPKIVIFGDQGVGKSYFSLQFPNVYYIDAEGGAWREQYLDLLSFSGGEYFGKENGASDFQEVIEQVKALSIEKHPFKTVVIDSMSTLFNDAVVKEMERLGEKDGFGASKKPAIRLTKILLNWLDKLDMNVILICREKAKWAGDKQVGVTYDGWDQLGYELDLCINIVLQGASRKGVVTKSRIKSFALHERFDWDFNIFAEKYGKEIISQEVKPTVFATEEQLKELSHYLEVINIPQETIDKWLEQAKVDKVEEMPTHFVAKILDAIKAKLK
jgi:hypothetical protein